MRITIKNKLLLLSLLLPFFIVILGILSINNYYALMQSTEMIKGESKEIDQIQTLRVAMYQLIMPPNDFLIHGNKNELNNFEQQLALIKKRLSRLEKIVASADEKRNLNTFKTRLIETEELSRQILLLEDPLNNQEGAEIMEDLDKLVFNATDNLKSVLTSGRIELADYIALSYEIHRSSQAWFFLTAVLMICFGLGTVYLINRSIMGGITKLLDGTVRVSKGDLVQKINVKSGDEIAELASSFNKMTDSLAISQNEVLTAKKYSEDLIENMTESLIVIDAGGFIKTVNKATLDLLGYTEEEIIGFPVAKIIEEEEMLIKGEKIITEGLADEVVRLGLLKDMELFYKTKNDEKIPVNFSGSVLKEEGQITGIIGIARDIRDLKKRIEYEKKLAIATASAEEGMKRALELEEMYHELEESKDAALNIMEDLDKQTKELQQEVGERKKTEKMLKKAYHEVELLANLVENAHEIVFIVESDGQILMSNSLAKEAFGYSKQELMDSNIMNLFKPDEDIKWETITDCVQRETHWRGNLIALKKYLGEFPAYVTFSAPVSGSGTGVENMICFIRDITEEKEIDRMKNEFISTVSHELRTPLSITREGISLIMDRIAGGINEKQEELLGTAMSNIDRLARIINDLLDVSKIESGKMELKRGKIDIFNLINQIKSTFEHKIKEKGLDLRISYPREGLLAYADEDRINQVYINLINNAIKFTEKGYIELLVIEKEKEVECIVADTGIGISKEDMPRLFSKFQQFGRTAGPGDKGTGLGLSIVKSLIEMHGGKIETRSSLNKGTVFTFTIPKYSTWNIFREHVHAGIKDAASRESSFSLLYINMPNFIEIERELGKNKADKVFEEIIHKVKKLLRRTCDVLVEDHSDIFILLPDTSKQGAGIVLKRIELTLKDFIEACKFEELKKLKLNFKDFTYPDDVTDYEKLLNKVQEAKNEKEDTIHRG